jgi:hypothetical protein
VRAPGSFVASNEPSLTGALCGLEDRLLDRNYGAFNCMAKEINHSEIKLDTNREPQH